MSFLSARRAATKREFDVVMAWSVDRLGRSLPDPVGFLGEIYALGIDPFPHRQGLDTRRRPAQPWVDGMVLPELVAVEKPPRLTI